MRHETRCSFSNRHFQAGVLSPAAVFHQGAHARTTSFTEMFSFVGLIVMLWMDSAAGNAAASASV